MGLRGASSYPQANWIEGDPYLVRSYYHPSHTICELGQRRSDRTLNLEAFLLGTQEDHLTELSHAARRAGSIVTEYINTIVDTAERQAEGIRLNANREADLSRQEALDSAKRVFERINALERPLGELVETLRIEMDRVGRELEGHVEGEAIGIAAESEDVHDQATTFPSPSPPGRNGKARRPSPPGGEPEVEVELPSELVVRPDEEAATEGARPVAVDEALAAPKETIAEPGPVEPAGAEARQAAAEPSPESARFLETKGEDEAVVAHPEDKPAVAKAQDKPAVAKGKQLAKRTPEPAAQAENPMSKLLSRFKGRSSKSVFITTEGHCAVCQRTWMADTENNLTLSDWRVNGEVGLCPECQSDRWQLPEGAKLPFRRGGP